MTAINVQFSDASESTIVSYFACAQDPKVLPNVGQVQANDVRWKVFYDSQPPATQPDLPAPRQ